jgi:hypothetical protein
MSDLPLPEKLPSTATEAEKQVRKALMNERKRCQTAANNKKRKRGAERSREEIDTVASASSKRAESGNAGGHRDGAGRKPKDVVANSIRTGRPRCDAWRINLCPNGETYVIQPLANSYSIKSPSLSDTAAKVFMKYPTAEVS